MSLELDVRADARRWPLPERALDALLSTLCDHERAEAALRAEDPSLHLDADLLRSAVGMLSSPATRYRLDKLVRLAWEVGIDPWRGQAPGASATTPTAVREALIPLAGDARVADSTRPSRVGESLVAGGERILLDWAVRPANGNDPGWRHLPVGAVVDDRLGSAYAGVGRAQIASAAHADSAPQAERVAR